MRKIDQNKFDQIKKEISQKEKEMLTSVSKKFKLSLSTVKRIFTSETYPAYKVKLVQTHKQTGDWLRDRGYEELGSHQNFINKIFRRKK